MSSASQQSKRARSSTAKTSREQRPKNALRSSKGSAKSGSATLRLNDDWRDFLHALISRGTRFLLIGGHAVAVHSEPRFTEDLDVFVAPDRRNAVRLRAALDDFGFESLAPPVRDLARPNRVWMLGRKPRRIDVLTGISTDLTHTTICVPPGPLAILVVLEPRTLSLLRAVVVPVYPVALLLAADHLAVAFGHARSPFVMHQPWAKAAGSEK